MEIAKGARKGPAPFARIEDAIEAIRAGKMVIVVDDEDRENEGDLTIAAEKITPLAIMKGLFLPSAVSLLVPLAVVAHNLRGRPVEAPLQDNIPVLMGLLGVWYRNVWGSQAQAVIPYDQRLGRFPAYLQQLDMESNGKSVTRAGAPVTLETAPVIWGEPGTNGQHAFFQMLHQGTVVIPVDFLVAAQPTHADPHHHALLVANCFAQSEALMRGRSAAEAEAGLLALGLDAAAAAALAPHKTFPGDRPSSLILLDRLTPEAFGALLALYEHKTFAEGIVLGLNSFDQWGVELGKTLAGAVLKDMGAATSGAHDPSTQAAIARVR
jgi:glucose-6-phosphate isomerase